MNIEEWTLVFLFLVRRRSSISTRGVSSAASVLYKRQAITHLVMALTNDGIELDEAGYIMSKDNAKWLEAFADAAVESGNEFGAKEAAMTSTEDGAPQVTAPKASKTLKAGK